MIPVLVCALAIFLLSAMDAAMKSLVIAVGVYNTVLWRSMLATVVAGAGWSAGPRSLPAPSVLRLHALRAVVVAIVLLCFFWGLARLPLAEAIGLSFVAPLFALLLAALLLGEKIQRQAIWASLAGIAGVAIIMAGQFGQSSYTRDALLGTVAVLVATVFYAYNLILSRQQAQVAKPVEIMLFQNLSVGVILGVAAPWLGVALPSNLWLPLAGVTALSLAGQFLMSWAYARAEAQYLIPTEYSAFIWAIALGFFFFDEAVTWTTLAGAGLIVASCLIATRSNPRLAEPIEAAV
ncbi:MAG: DMT family transporter [Mesorhizobium sp.]|nr:DMT family transporter [bacterium M00.F.Ca.ET.205.01.1.1]TGU55972.1 DMT family transporter [bacterium M00.F.Ca.ET.152.01.1.1]TGV40604.1 DMT family transporter [Mesorhizobium sp. M00.F.Ca.ET.186.01.1.1]TGZ45584.1 DMT family transporter [bacterium M00.F.Ca.ET.162.01.1.1]TJW34491.1 MAG: DMT family transporter [Mesorhizobium sp.]